MFDNRITRLTPRFFSLTVTAMLLGGGWVPTPGATDLDASEIDFSAQAAKTHFHRVKWTDYGIERVLVRGAALRTANGINFNQDGHLFVASLISRSITKLSPRSGRILDFLGHEEGVETPDDLTFGPDGSLYWTAFFSGEVGRLSPAGVKSTVATLAPGVNAITMSDDGRLFVSRVFLGDELYEVDPEGIELPRLVAKELGGFNAMDFGPDGHLYGPQWFLGQVARIDVDNGYVTTVATGLHTPAAVKFNSHGELYVIDQHQGDVRRVDIATGSTELVAHGDPGLDNLAFDRRDRLYLSNTFDGSIKRLLPNGKLRTVSRGGLTAPGGVAVREIDGRKTLFVSDTYTLRNYDARTGRLLKTQYSSVGDLNGLVTPLTVAPHGDNLVVTSWFGQTVQVWDPMSDEIVAMHLMSNPPLNAIGFEGGTVVAELVVGDSSETEPVNSCVIKLPATVGKAEPLACGFFVPAGLAQQNGNLWVSDWASGVIWHIANGGKALPEPVPVATGLLQPEGMATDLDGQLLVVETGRQRLLRIDPITGEQHVVAENLPQALPAPDELPPTWVLNSVAVDDCGSIYLSQDSTGHILKIDTWESIFCY